MTAKELIAFAAKQMALMFDELGRVWPMYHVIRRNGDHVIVPAPSSNIASIKQTFEKLDAVAYVYTDEAWIVELPSDTSVADAENVVASTHPHRREVIMFVAEDATGEWVARMDILRPEHGGKARLLPLNTPEQTWISEGRTTGLLPRQGSVH